MRRGEICGVVGYWGGMYCSGDLEDWGERGGCF